MWISFDRNRMAQRQISEVDVEYCLSHPSSTYLDGTDTIYVCADKDGKTIKIRVRSKSVERIIDAFRVG